MKRWIAAGSICLSFCFAFALASVDDHSGPKEAARSSLTQSNTGSVLNISSNETKVTKSCTNEHGVTFQNGQPGYQTCVEDFEKSRPESQKNLHSKNDENSHEISQESSSQTSEKKTATTHQSSS